MKISKIVTFGVLIFGLFFIGGCTHPDVGVTPTTDVGSSNQPIMNDSGSSSLASPSIAASASPDIPVSSGSLDTGVDQAGAHDATFYVEEIVRNYVELKTEAINNKDFSQVSDLLQPGSAIYVSEKKAVSDSIDDGVSEKLIDCDVDVREASGSGTYEAEVTETLSIKSSSRPDNLRRVDKWRFTVIVTDSDIYISDIVKMSK